MSKKSFSTRFSEFVSGIASNIKSLFTGSSSSRKTSSDPYDLDLNNPSVLGARNDKTTLITPEMVRRNQMERAPVPKVATPKSYAPDPKAIKTAIGKIPSVIKGALKDANLGDDIRQAAQKVQESAGKVKDEPSLDEFKGAVGNLQSLTQSYKGGPANTTAYNLAHFSDTVSTALQGVSMRATPANAPHASSGERVVNMTARASQINSAAKHFKTGGKGKHATKQEEAKAQSKVKAKVKGPDSVSL
jgi:hypothetical protein